MGTGDTLRNAVIGAVVTVVLSFTGFSPLLGGGVAGYLQRESRRSGAKVGALSGVVASVPTVFLFVVFFAVLVAGPTMGRRFGAGVGIPGGIELALVLVLFLPFLILWFGGLGAIGGYLGAYLREETATPGENPEA